jgi:hypothetical protein
MRLGHASLLVSTFVGILAVAGCMKIGLPGEEGAAGSSGAAGSGGTGVAACSGFRDVLGRCGELSCLQTATCDVKKQGTDCPPSAAGAASCFGGKCAYVQAAFACTSPDDCPCALCGADGKCYGADTGACGLCETGAKTTTPAERPLPCKTCLADCQGTGPSCCAGCGCACEGVCGACF